MSPDERRRHNERRRQRYAEDPELRERVSERNRKRREKMTDEEREKNNAKARERYAKLPSARKKAIIARQQEWLKDNPEKWEKYLERKKAESRKRYRQQLEKAVKYLGGRCQQCGLEDHPVVYDFHHREPANKDFELSRMLGHMSWDKLKAEIDKCDLLCSHCHRKLHAKSWIKQADRASQGESSRSH